MSIIRRILFLFLFLSVSLAAQSYEEKLQNATRSIGSASNPTVWKGYHEYQSLYMMGLLENNKTLQIKALEGLIEASTKLGLDPRRYKNALQVIAPLHKKKSVGREKRSSLHTGKKAAKKRAIVEMPEEDLGKRAKVTDIQVDKERLKLTFSRSLGQESAHHFVLKRKKNYLYVFDIAPARLPFSIKRYKGGSVKEVRIAQYDPRKIRVVIETEKRYRPKILFNGRDVKIPLPASAKKRDISPLGTLVGAKRKRAKSPTRIYTVVIDPGHGGKDSGAIGYRKRLEKDAVLAVAKDLAKILKKRGFRVYMTRKSDRFIPLKERTHLANRKKADFFISIHANAAASKRNYLKNRGIETYFLSPARTARAKRVAALENRADIANIGYFTKNDYLHMLNREKIIQSNKLAMDIQDQTLKSVRKKFRDVVDNGVRNGPFWVLVGAQMPAVLIEIGYITHPIEGKRLFNPYYRKLLAEGIANGITNYIYRNRE